MTSSSVWKICVCHVHDLFTGMRVRDVFIMSGNSDRLQRVYPIVSFIKTGETVLFGVCVSPSPENFISSLYNKQAFAQRNMILK